MCSVTYSSCPGNTIRSKRRASPAGETTASRSSSARNAACRPDRAYHRRKPRSYCLKWGGTPLRAKGLSCNRCHGVVCVPGVDGAVAVVVAEVVRLPGERRNNDGHARAEGRPGPKDERRVDRLPAGPDACEVDAGCPVMNAYDDHASGCSFGVRDRHAAHRRVAVRRAALWPRAEELELNRTCRACDGESGLRAWGIAGRCEDRLESVCGGGGSGCQRGDGKCACHSR
jgi:hypothetical protein